MNAQGVAAHEKNVPEEPGLMSEAAILIEANSGQILYEKNADTPMYPASITKIASAIYAIENGNLDDIVTISENAANTKGSSVFLEEGEQAPLGKLVQGMLINSGNDAGTAIAEHLSGSVEQFSSDFNTYLEEKVGTKNTHFENSHGLFDAEHMTTAEDMAKITQYAMDNETFMDIFSTKELAWDGETWDTTIQTHHRLLKGEIPYETITGGKNGYVNQSGFTLVTTAERNGLELIAVTMKASSDIQSYEDTVELLDYGFDNFANSSLEEGKTYTVNNKEFQVPETTSYTHASQQTTNEDISEDGVLTLSDSLTSTTIELEKVEKNKPAPVQRVSNDKPSELFGMGSHWIFIFAFVFVVISVVGLLFWQSARNTLIK
nr:D-alanyl-D-alanine carboxypeptidase family protein [Oceanobacillus piezotolerans]